MINMNTIENPVWHDVNAKSIKFNYSTETQKQKVAITSAPSTVFDYIINHFGEDYLDTKHKERVQEREKKHQQQREFRENQKEAEKIAKLFETKLEVMRLPWIDKDNSDLILSIRTALDIRIVEGIAQCEFAKYAMKKTYNEINEEMEQIIYERDAS